MKLLTRLAKRALLSRSPVHAGHVEATLLFSAFDERSGPDSYLLDLALKAVQEARNISLAEISARVVGRKYTDIWPGEHYKLLAGIVRVMQPALIIEVGTATGASALALRKFLPEHGRVVTFDIIPWQSYPSVCLRDEDFLDGRLEQRIEDISDPASFRKNESLLENAELIFLDAAKDGVQEQVFLDNFARVRFRTPPIIICDDIRLWNMLKIWRRVQRPKLDLTSFGHWCGTGLIHWV
jgi:predicted O-methyltransferase YrrM